MTAVVPHVIKRDGVYQYHRRVPGSVIHRPLEYQTYFGGQKLFRKSLRTKDQGEMFAAAAVVHAEFEDLVARATGKPQPMLKVASMPLRKVTQADLDDIRERFRDITARPFEQAHLQADRGPAFAAELERMIAEFETNAEALSASLSRRPVSGAPEVEGPTEAAKALIAREKLAAPFGSEDFAAIVASIRAGMKDGYDRVEALNDGRAIPRLPTPTPKRTASSITLREAVDQYVTLKKVTPKTLSEIELSLTTFEALNGNKRLSAVCIDDFRTFAKWMSEQKVGGATAGSVHRTMALPTGRKRIGYLSSAIKLAIDRGTYDGTNPASGVNLSAWFQKPDKSVMPSKRPFTVAELNQIFQHPWFTGCQSSTDTHNPGDFRLNGMEYWGPVVALYTGMRASELGGLQLSEIFLDGDYPHIVVRPNKFRGVKNSENRSVPILDALMRLGFREYVARIRASGAERLFPDWKPRNENNFDKANAAWSNSSLMRAFNRTVIKKMLGDTLPTDARQEVTFHNLRSSFKTMLTISNFNLNHNIINEVVGHAKNDLDARYVGTISIEATYQAIHQLDYKNLNIPILDAP
jgi:integrase